MSDPNIYEQLNTFTLSNVSAEDIMNITDKTHLQFQNEFDLERYNLINRATFRDGNPIPNSGGIVQFTQTGDTDYADIKPPKGEVWNIQSISASNSPSVTGTNTYFTYWAGPNITGLTNAVYHSAISSGSNAIPAESLFEEVFQPLIVTNQAFLRVYSNMDNVGTSAVVNWNVAYNRLR
tara:strand:- start:93 stop:629 length:537 start_codon:yes stop_codon:yes gene_type:complete